LIPSTLRFPFQRTYVYPPPVICRLCAQITTDAQLPSMIASVHLMYVCAGWGEEVAVLSLDLRKSSTNVCTFFVPYGIFGSNVTHYPIKLENQNNQWTVNTADSSYKQMHSEFRVTFFFSGSASQRGLWYPRSRGFLIIHNDALQSVGLLWTSDQLVAGTST
jgi:hypothetical protein